MKRFPFAFFTLPIEPADAKAPTRPDDRPNAAEGAPVEPKPKTERPRSTG